LRIIEARAGLVPIDLAGWLGREPTNSERVLFHREYIRLEDVGLIERCNLHGDRGGRRTTHLRLTPAGHRIAEELLVEKDPGDEPDSSFDLDAVEFLPIEWPLDQLSSIEDDAM
jgi:DNA-binding MarR family transcriptional regulator